jgi:predicted ester cyclase
VSVEDNKALVRFLIDEALNKGNFGVATEEYFQPDYTVHTPAAAELPRGPEAFKLIIRLWQSAFEGWHLNIEQLVAEGDFVANRFTTTGRHTGPLMGIPPTGREMVVRSQELHRIQDGRLAETWVVDDLPSILVQLGAYPPPPVGGPPPGGAPGREG